MNRKNPTWTESEYQSALSLKDNRYTYKQIGEELGRNWQDVSNYMKARKAGEMRGMKVEKISQPIKPKVHPDIAFGERLYKRGYISAQSYMNAKVVIASLAERRRG